MPDPDPLILDVELELLHVDEDGGVITLDFVMLSEMRTESGTLIAPGQPFAVHVEAAGRGDTATAVDRLRDWATRGEPVLAGTTDWRGLGPVVVLAQRQEAVFLRFQ